MQGFIAIAVADVSDALLLPLAAAKQLQCCQSLNHIQKVSAHERKRCPLRLGALLCIAAHQGHQHWDNRAREEQQHGAEPVDRQDHNDDK